MARMSAIATTLIAQSALLKSLGLTGPIGMIISILLKGFGITDKIIEFVIKLFEWFTIPLDKLIQMIESAMTTNFDENSFIGKILKFLHNGLIDLVRFFSGDKTKYLGERSGEERVALHQTIERIVGKDATTMSASQAKDILLALQKSSVDMSALGIDGITKTTSATDIEILFS